MEMKMQFYFFRILIFFLLNFSFIFANENTNKEDQWDGKKYQNHSELQYQWAASYIPKLHLKGDERILDIGCGDGRVTAYLAKVIPNGYIMGIDHSASMLKVAQELKNKIQFSNLDFLERDAINLDFENEFDYVVSFSCFHWISDHFSALRGIEKALKPNGKVFLYFSPDYGKNRIDHAINAIANSSKWSNYFFTFSNPHSLITPIKFITYADEVGLFLKRVENIIVDEVFSNKAEFAAWIGGWLAHLKHLPQNLHQEFLEEIVDSYLEKHPIDNENQLHYIGYWIEIELLKP